MLEAKIGQGRLEIQARPCTRQNLGNLSRYAEFMLQARTWSFYYVNTLYPSNKKAFCEGGPRTHPKLTVGDV